MNYIYPATVVFLTTSTTVRFPTTPGIDLSRCENQKRTVVCVAVYFLFLRVVKERQTIERPNRWKKGVGWTR